jgi:hypothetical protein
MRGCRVALQQASRASLEAFRSCGRGRSGAGGVRLARAPHVRHASRITRFTPLTSSPLYGFNRISLLLTRMCRITLPCARKRSSEFQNLLRMYISMRDVLAPRVKSNAATPGVTVPPPFRRPHTMHQPPPLLPHSQEAIDWWLHMGGDISFSPSDSPAVCIEHADIILGLCGRCVYSSLTLQDSSSSYIQRTRSALKEDPVCCRAGILPLFYSIPLGADTNAEHVVLLEAVMRVLSANGLRVFGQGAQPAGAPASVFAVLQLEVGGFVVDKHGFRRCAAAASRAPARVGSRPQSSPAPARAAAAGLSQLPASRNPPAAKVSQGPSAASPCSPPPPSPPRFHNPCATLPAVGSQRLLPPSRDTRSE